MARLNVEQKALSDRRFQTLGRLLGESRHAALGRMLMVWNECQERETYLLTSGEIDDTNPDAPSFSDAVIAAGLARHEDDAVYICGTRGRIEWLAQRRSEGKRATGGGRPPKLKLVEPVPVDAPETPRGLPGETPPALTLESGSNLSSPKKEELGSIASSSARARETTTADDGAAEEQVEILTTVIRQLCPQLKRLDRRNVLGWIADYRDQGPWWIAAALIEGNGTMAKARSPSYITETLRNRHADEFQCPEAEQFVRHLLQTGGVTAEGRATFRGEERKDSS